MSPLHEQRMVIFKKIPNFSFLVISKIEILLSFWVRN